MLTECLRLCHTFKMTVKNRKNTSITYDFTNKVVLVTGGSSGIGAACVRHYAALGAKVIIAARRETESQAVIDALPANNDTVHFHQTDVANSESVASLFEFIQTQFGRLDILINNAGIAGSIEAHIHELSEEDWHKVMSINSSGAFYCMRHALKMMHTQQSGNIVNVSSVAGLKGGKVNAAYTASKHGLIGLTRNAAINYAEYNIRVNAVCPSITDTDMLRRDLPHLIALAPTIIPMKRCGTTDEVVAAILWLSSEASLFVNGVSLPIDGGATA